MTSAALTKHKEQAEWFTADTQGTPPEALIAGADAAWRQLIDVLLDWSRNGYDLFDPGDVPTPEIVQSAIDFAYDESSDESSPLPTNIAPSGNGHIAFEYNDAGDTVLITFIGAGRAEFTHFVGDRVKSFGYLRRDPQTRRLALREA